MQGQTPGGETDWAAIQAWLVETAGPPPSSGGDAIEQSAAWQRAVELFAAGLTKESGGEFRALIDAHRPAWDYYKLARMTSEEGQAQLAALAATALAGGGTDAPRALLAVEYPARFSGAAEAAAKANDLPLPLLLGLVRQESFFDPAAISSAGAVGLTQVVASTAMQIAAELKDSAFKQSDLLKPQVSLRFGAHYLKSQIDGFDACYAAALAAYNGGPGNAGRWQEAAGGDEDLLLESIDYPETRTYVKVVLENYAMYAYVYGTADAVSPALP